MSKNEKTLQAFAEYCRAHPEERFWQALRNFSGFAYVGVAEDDKMDWIDTFHFRDGMELSVSSTYFQELND